MTDGPPDPDYFMPEEYNQYVSVHTKMPLGDKEVITTVKRQIVKSMANPSEYPTIIRFSTQGYKKLSFLMAMLKN